MEVDVLEIAKRAMDGKLATSAQEVIVAGEMVEVARQEEQAAEDNLSEAIENFNQERMLCFLSELARQDRTWCSLHRYFVEEGHASYYTCKEGGLVDGRVETSLILVVKNCWRRGDHYGSDSEWTEEHVHTVCPECLEEARDGAGSGVFSSVYRAEMRDDEIYYKVGRDWQKLEEGQRTHLFMAPSKLLPGWEEEFGIPLEIKR